MRALPEAGTWTVYMLRCRDGSLYTGMTNDLGARVERHQRGKGAAYTRSRLPVRLVFHELVDDRSAALKREAALKRLTRQQKLAFLKSALGRPASRRGTPGTRPPRGRS